MSSQDPPESGQLQKTDDFGASMVALMEAEPEHWWQDPGAIELIRRKIRAVDKKNKIDDEQIAQYLYFARRRNLNPLLNQIYAIPRAPKQGEDPVLTYQVGIDGLRTIAHRTGLCTGIRAKPIHSDNGSLVGAWAEVGRKGHSFYSYVRLSEYIGSNPSPVWRSKPETMLMKCAEAAALRKAFPEETGGIYTEEEFKAQEEPLDVTPPPRTIAQSAPKLTERPALDDLTEEDIQYICNNRQDWFNEIQSELRECGNEELITKVKAWIHSTMVGDENDSQS